MGMKRISYILLIFGGVIVLGSIIAFAAINHFVPDPEGSDPQKDQYLFGIVFAGLFGAAIAATGFGLLVRSLHKCRDDPRQRR